MRRDAAYTDRGAKKTAKGSAFKTAADRLNETRKEKERFDGIIVDSEGAENLIRELTDRRTQKQGAWATAMELSRDLQRLSDQSACRAVAAEQIRLAQDELMRIQLIGTNAEEAERKTEQLAGKITEARQELDLAKTGHAATEFALRSAEESARAENPDSDVASTVVAQQLQLRRANAEQAALVARQK